MSRSSAPSVRERRPREGTRAAARLISDMGARSRLRNGTHNRHRAARLLDRFHRGLGCARDLERQPGGYVALAEDLDAVTRLRDHSGRHEGLDRDRRALVDLAGRDGLLDAAEVDLVELATVRLVEAPLGQTPVQWHLTALEALDRHAGSGLLALDAAAARLALAGADTPADAHAVPGRTFVVADFVEFHDALLTARPGGSRGRARGASPFRSCRARTACPPR